MSDTLINVENISKKFCKRLRYSLWFGLNDMTSEVLGRDRKSSELRKQEFWAVKDASFMVERGDVMGLIGPNGAGKTTMLKMLNGLLKPDTGRITMKGRIGAMIALGAGFSPILTGRENIYINAAVMGISKREVEKKFDQIVEISGLEEYLDTPVQNYSTGMYVRLGFAIAVHCEPDILLIDEILAVGDAQFRNKCFDRIGTIKKNAAVVLVSHNMSSIAQMCNKCLNLDKGETVYYGDVEGGVQKYTDMGDSNNIDGPEFIKIYDPIENATIDFDNMKIKHGETIGVTIKIDCREGMLNNILRINFYDNMGVEVGEWHSLRLGLKIDLKKGKNIIKLTLGPFYFKTGEYKLGIVLNDSTAIREVMRSYKQHCLKISSGIAVSITYQLPRKDFHVS
ncbi:MAG: ABC transporter ATP-binding protein [Pseudomonadota bacterium]